MTCHTTYARNNVYVLVKLGVTRTLVSTSGVDILSVMSLLYRRGLRHHTDIVAEKKVTREELAEMISRGFEATATKVEVDELREVVGALREDTDSHFQAVERKLGAMENDIKEIKIVLGPLVRIVA